MGYHPYIYYCMHTPLHLSFVIPSHASELSAGGLHARLQEALARGALSGADVLLWLRTRAVPVVGWVCQRWPAFRHALCPSDLA